MKALSGNTIRTIATYTALTIGVTVGGVVIGAMVIAPAVSRAKPLLKQAMAVTSPAEVQAPAKPTVAVLAPFKPMVSALELQAIADSVETLARQVATKPTGVAAAREATADLWRQLMAQAGRMPKRGWIAVDVAAIAAILGLTLLARRRRNAPRAGLMASALGSTPRAGARAAGPRTSRTPKAVVALAESGASATDIARRTRMPLDAVSMCLSMGTIGGTIGGTMGARQLQPPTA